ncbi:uncharacterized protein [Solanum tuberosum]|uniref:uncharacterized protein isoform X1 n=1 Tax=Solanum tuberosum TaxID=4113 RepID=UPI00073A4030|nr:PREDICTED: uncharacterized protein LOC102581996 isoform X1 [Solanum tuberosum]
MLMHSSNHKFDRPGEAEASIQKRRSNNYSQVSDGAAAVLLMKRSIAMQKALPILGVFREYSGPSLSYYINNFKPMKVVQASAHLPQILCCYSGLDNFFLSFGDRYNSPEYNVKQLYTLCITKKYCKMLTLEILTSSTAHSLSSTIFEFSLLGKVFQ